MNKNEVNNSVDELKLLGQKYGFSNKLNEKMSFRQFLTFLENTINVKNKKIDTADIAKLVSFCRKDMYDALISIIKGIRDNDEILLKEGKYKADIKIQSILAMCYGSLTTAAPELRAINQFDKYINTPNISNSKLLKQAKITLIMT